MSDLAFWAGAVLLVACALAVVTARSLYRAAYALSGVLLLTAAFYAGFDIFALSSDTEQMPLSLIEAMASGLPVVSTDVGDVATMVAAENRRFVVAPDDSAMASALALLTADLVVRREIGAANLAKARAEFGQAAMFDAYGALWRG